MLTHRGMPSATGQDSAGKQQQQQQQNCHHQEHQRDISKLTQSGRFLKKEEEQNETFSLFLLAARSFLFALGPLFFFSFGCPSKCELLSSSAATAAAAAARGK